MSVQVERRYAADSLSPTAARSFVSEMLELWDCDDAEEIACLLTNELVTNAVVHAATEIVLRMKLDPPTLLVEVEDGADDLPQPVELTPYSEHGRGLLLIDSLSRRWGARRCPPGKVVWFELTVGAADPQANQRPERAEAALSRRAAV